MKRVQAIFLSVVIGLWGCSGQGVADDQIKVTHHNCSENFSQSIQALHESIIHSWTAIDLWRSASMSVKDRHHCAKQILDDILVVLVDVRDFATTCQICSMFYHERNAEILQVVSLLDYLFDAFKAVFLPAQSSEEQFLLILMLKAARIMDECVKNQRQYLAQKSNCE